MVRAFTALESQDSLESVLAPTSQFPLYFKKVGQYFLSAYVDRPPIVDKNGNMTVSPHDGVLYLRCESHRDLALLTLVGRWAYLWWMMYGDEFNVTRGTLAAFPGDIEGLERLGIGGGNHPAGDMEFESLMELSRTLRDEMPNHIAWKDNAGVRVGRYNILKLRHITDRADWVLAQAWGIEDAFEAAGLLRDRMIFGNKE